jgi:4-hydroxy-tetrahydrodipicolinate synthase
MKESEGNFELVKAILKEFPHFQLLVGNETMIADAVSLGAAGGVSGIANICPQLICSLYKGKERQHEIEAFMGILKNQPFIPSAKSIMEQKKGAPWSSLRPPLTSLTSEQKLKFTEEFQKLGAN